LGRTIRPIIHPVFAVEACDEWFAPMGRFMPPQTKILEKATFTFYPSQTKILEGGTKDEIRIFAALFKGVSTRFGLLTVEKCCENPDFIFCSSFQNLRLGSIHLRK
jgi:hypothetical protein